jgi:hypothetical protein
LGHPILFWEIPHRRSPELGEASVALPGGFSAPETQLDFVESELVRVLAALENLTGRRIGDEALADSIASANEVRSRLWELRALVFTAERCPMPALEMLIAEMLAIHYCSDREETLAVLADLLAEVKRRIALNQGYFGSDAVKVFWVNPVADLVAMNLLEECGGRICGTEYLFSHALDPIPADLRPTAALARMALADPMVGSSMDRARRIADDIRRFGSEAVVISKIPGASHCAHEGRVIAEVVRVAAGIPVLEIEVAPLSDSLQSSIKARLQALIETARANRKEDKPVNKVKS